MTGNHSPSRIGVHGMSILLALSLLLTVEAADAQSPSGGPSATASGQPKRTVGIGGFYGEIGQDRSPQIGRTPPRREWPAGARPLDLEAPVGCTMDRDCVIASYMDREPGVSAKDYRCGSLTDDAETRTVVRGRDMSVIQAGLLVQAAAAGQVVAVRDDVADRSPRRLSALARLNPNPGNHVVIDHGDGWQTEYQHLRQNSVTVQIGDSVQAGQTLGLVGQSGDAPLPQVGFRVTLAGQPVDPFVGLRDPAPCGTPPHRGLWSHAAARSMRYVESAVLASGFAAQTPRQLDNLPAIKTREPDNLTAPVVFWVRVHGLQTGDREQLELIGPDGKQLRRARFVFPRDRDNWVSLIRASPPVGGWKPGSYTGRYRLFRVDGNSRMRMEPVLVHDDVLRLR